MAAAEWGVSRDVRVEPREGWGRGLGGTGGQRLTGGGRHVLVHAEQELPGGGLHVGVHVVGEDGRRLDEERQRRWGQAHHLEESRDNAAAPQFHFKQEKNKSG